MIEKKEISFFLRFGYFPDFEPIHVPQAIDQLDLQGKTYKELQDDFCFILDEVFQEMVTSIEDKNVVIPISGGLDSRLILAEALKYIPLNKIKTYTFGMKGSYDFEIGIEVAKKAKVKHYAIELNSLELNHNEMLETAKKCYYQAYLFYHPPISKLKEIIGNDIVLSGYLGDLVFGSYADKAKKMANPKKWYIENIYHSSYNKLKQENFNFFDSKIYDINYDSHISPEEQLILYEKGPKITAPQVLMKGWDYKLPLIDKRILDFMFSLPNEYRVGEKFFIETMLIKHPDLFNIRSKTSFGRHLTTSAFSIYRERLKNLTIKKLNRIGFDFVYPPFNYIDFNKAIIERKDLKAIFIKNLTDLEGRDILEGMKPLEIYNKHKKKKNLAPILIALTSLELILKSRKI